MAIQSLAPLLSNYNSTSSQESADSQSCEYQGWRSSLSQVAEEIKKLYAIALPMIFIGLLTYGKSLISMYFMGKLGKNELAGGCLSIGIANITGYSIISGLSTGMEAISSQAYGANMWVLMGQTLQRTIVILLTACLPISLLWLYSEPILVFCGQEPVISSIAYSYLLFSLPDIVFQSIINPLRIFLRTQNINLPLMLSAIIALTLHAPINYVLVCQLSLNDIRGIAMAGAITDFIILAFLVLYLHHTSVCNNTLQGWSDECYRELTPILRQAVSGCISVCLEWWWYEIMIILSGLLFNATEAVATMGIVIQATSLVYIFPLSFSQAVSTRVGNELGANCPHNAKISTWIALACAVFMSIVATFFMTAMRNTWGCIFTDDATILSLTAMSMPVVGLCEIGNWLQTTGYGVLRASTRPTLAANINFGSLYGVGLPVALIMGFVLKMGLFGFWFGLLAAQVVCAIVMMVVVLRTNWIELSERDKDLTGRTVDDQEDD